MLIYKKNIREMLGNHMFYNGLGAINDFGLRLKSSRIDRFLEGRRRRGVVLMKT